jgi:hypothetical protein
MAVKSFITLAQAKRIEIFGKASWTLANLDRFIDKNVFVFISEMA